MHLLVLYKYSRRRFRLPKSWYRPLVVEKSLRCCCRCGVSWAMRAEMVAICDQG